MKLSIITVNLNNRSGLQKTIDSVISQTFKDFEWIIIDGGSTDGSKELIEQYAEHITYWVSEPDKGIYNAMNKGIKVAQGEYLLFLNSGDWLFSKQTLKKIFQNKQGCDIIYGNLFLMNKTITKCYSLHSNYVSCHDLINGIIAHPASFIKRELFAQYGLYNENLKIVADWEFFLKAVLNNCSFKYINEDIAYFDKNGVSSLLIKEREKEREEVLQSILPQRILEDYRFNLQQNEVRKYRLSRILFAILYRSVRFYERIRYGE